MRGRTVPFPGTHGLSLLLLLSALSWSLSGCGAQLSPVSASGNQLTRTPPGAVKIPTGTAKKAPSTFRLTGKAATSPVLTPAALNFAGTQIGSASLALTVTVVAQYDHPLTAHVTDGTAFAVVADTSCAVSNAACTLSVTFRPTVVVAASAQLSVTDTVNGLTTEALLTGTGLPVPTPVLSLPVSAMSFAATQLGATSAAQTITLSNSGSAPLALSAFVLTGANHSEYNEQNTCNAPLPPGGTCSVAVSFSPTAVGTRSATLQIANNTSATPAIVTLTGTGAPVPAPVLALSVSTLGFGATQVGTSSAAQTITLSNTGTAPLTFSSLVLTGAESTDYTQRNTCGAPLAPGGTCAVSISFSPVATGTRAATLQIAGNAYAVPATVALTGTGIPAPAPVLTLPVSAIAFPSTPVGTTTAAQPIVLANTGDAPLVISAFVLTGTDGPEYTQRNTCSAALAPGATCTLTVFFTPAGTGGRPATLQLISNASATPAALTLSGTATAVAGNALIPGANAVLPFSETTGTVAHDTSGNGNDCSFASGGNAPTWANSGLHFNNGTDDTPRFCTLPASTTNADASVMNSRTLTLCAYFSPVNALNDRSYAAVFGGSSRFDIGALFLSGDAHVRSAYYMGDYFGYGGVPTYTTQPLVGYHCVTYALGSATDGTLDHFYIDDAEVTSYGAKGTVWDKRAAGDFYEVGAIPWDGGSYLWGTVYAVVAYPSQLTSSGVAHNFAVLQQSSFYSRGVGASSAQNTSSTNVLVTNGDSITNQTPGGVLPYPYLLSLNRTFSVSNTAIAGKLLETEVADSSLMDLPLYSPNAPFAFASNAAGINDINVGGSSQAQIAAYRATINATYKQQGFTVLSPTLVSSLGADAELQAINTALRADAAAHAYFIVDWANEPCLGATGAYADSGSCRFFQSDGLHPSQAGNNEMARLYSNVVNYLTGSTASSPKTVTAASYTLAAADRFLVAQGTMTQTITLPDCYGWSATTPFTLTNGNLSGVTLVPSAGFTLDGDTAAVALPVGTTLKVYADLLSSTASGCGWFTR